MTTMSNNDLLRASVFGFSDTGMQRSNNEDANIARFIWDDNHILCAAIDGIGGYEGGEIAAAIARDTIIRYVNAYPSSHPLTTIKQALVEANNEIVRAKEGDPKLSQMGCVCTAAIIDTDDCLLYMAHVGDSRLYQWTGGVMTKLSHDHSLVGYREEVGDLTEHEAMHHPMRNQIERSLGDRFHQFDDENFIEATIFPITGQTQFLFCSDGLSDMLTSAQIASKLSNNSTPQQEVDSLIDAANAAGGKDNITVVIAKLDLPGGRNTTPTSDDRPLAAVSSRPEAGTEKEEKEEKEEQPHQDNHHQHHHHHLRRRPRRLPWILLIITLLVGAAAAYLIYNNLKQEAENEEMLEQQKVTVVEGPVNELDSTARAEKDSVATVQAKSAAPTTVDSVNTVKSALLRQVADIDKEKQRLDQERAKLNREINRLNDRLRDIEKGSNHQAASNTKKPKKR